MKKDDQPSASLEDYLEAIYHIEAEKGAARAKDVGTRLQVKPSSVTGALRALAGRGLINYAPYDVITLTPEGAEIARGVTRRHEALRDFFVEVLGVEAVEAEAVACDMEHALSKNVLERLLDFMDFLRTCPRAGDDWIRQFRDHRIREADPQAYRRWLKGQAARRQQAHDQKTEAPMTVSLTTIKTGQRATIRRITATKATRKRIADMGLNPGVLIEVERIAPLGDPVEFKVKGYHLSLRKEEAEGIQVEPIGLLETGT